MGKESTVHLDIILKQLGAFGRYNILNYALLLFPIFLAGMFASVYVFEAPDIQYRCKIAECEGTNESLWISNAIPMENGKYSKCSRYAYNTNITFDAQCPANIFNNTQQVMCESYVYGEQDSAIKDFDLACQHMKRTLIGSVHNVGLFVSLPITGIMSDKYGRKKALAVASLMNGIFGLLRSFSSSYIMMLLLEFMETASGAGAYSCAFVFAMELVGPKGRVIGNTFINAAYVFGLITLSGLSWLLDDWRNLLRIIYFPALLVISYYWILDESIRWLLTKERTSEAVAIIQKAAKMNNVELSEELLCPLHKMESITRKNSDMNNKNGDINNKNSDINDKNGDIHTKGGDIDIKESSDRDNADSEVKPLREDKEEGTDLEAGAEVKQVSPFVQAIRSRVIRFRLMVCSFLWISCTFVYYGLSINSVALAGNMYANFMLVSIVEIPANVVCLLVLDRYGRKRTLITMYVLSACMCISLSLVPKDQKWWSLAVYLSGKFSITVAYSAVYIYVSEVFPTSVRQSMLAICSSIGRVGSTLAPLTPMLALYHKNLPSVFFGSIALVASVLVFSLPETINVALPDTIEEAEGLSKKPSSDGVTNDN